MGNENLAFAITY